MSLLKDIMEDNSITPNGKKSLYIICSFLEKLGFICQIIPFNDINHNNNSSNTHTEVYNLYAKYGKGSFNLCFAGHVDVVPTGDIQKWKFNPFNFTIDKNILYGRGIVDMKGAIVSYISAIEEFLPVIDQQKMTFSIMLTTDEEGIAENGIKKLLPYLKNQGENLSFCLVGEPVSKNSVGDIIKIGSRGSATFKITVRGTQGHVAYHEYNDNPAKRIIRILNRAVLYKFDNGDQYFSPSNLEITTMKCDSGAENIVPEVAFAQFNIRYGNKYTAEILFSIIEKEIIGEDIKFTNLEYHSSGDSFISTQIDDNLKSVANAIFQVSNIFPEFSTYGGTSDARFIKEYCPVIEIGLLGSTAHQINENCSIDDLNLLKNIYNNVISTIIKKYL
ncbi:succinyl-diaminopimelate desuccinylase [Lyticum sinuosum]|nr:succinyl-diaminopimelate desuccinylase [Lyticum sinuosum]